MRKSSAGVVSPPGPRWAAAIILLIAVHATSCCRSRGSKVVVEIVRTALPSIVTVRTSGGMAQGVGSGFVVRGHDGDKVIVTNHHVIWGAAQITVEFFDGSSRPTTVARDDEKVDLAVLRLPSDGPTKIPVLSFGDDQDLQPGDSLISIGSPAGIPHAVSVGIFSARGKKPGTDSQGALDCLFTDAVLSPGTSGGPVLNGAGQVVGVNVGQAGQTSGLGVVIPASFARRIAGP